MLCGMATLQVATPRGPGSCPGSSATRSLFTDLFPSAAPETATHAAGLVLCLACPLLFQLRGNHEMHILVK